QGSGRELRFAPRPTPGTLHAVEWPSPYLATFDETRQVFGQGARARVSIRNAARHALEDDCLQIARQIRRVAPRTAQLTLGNLLQRGLGRQPEERRLAGHQFVQD